MTKSKDLAQAVEKVKEGTRLGLDPRFVPSGAYEQLKHWLVGEKLNFIHSAGIHGGPGSGKSILAAELFQEGAKAGWPATVTNEPLSRAVFQVRPTLPTAERVGEEALRAQVSELEQKLAQAEHINRVQRSRLSEERRAAATANRINDQLQQRLDELQQRLDRQIDVINERARANDVALAALAAKSEGRLLTYETLQGEVVEVSEAEVVVRFDTGDDLIEQTYDLGQFTLGKAPSEGDQLAVYVHVALVAPPPLAAGTESKADLHESPRPRRNVITGDHRF